MKTTLVTALILLTTTFAFSSCKDSSYTPPKNVVSAFKAKYPSAKRVEWEVKNTYQVAEFHIDFTEIEAWFDNNGQWVMTESDVKFSSLPVVIRNSFKSGEYGKWEVEDVDKLERAGMETIYIIEAELGEQEVALHYLENGTLVKPSWITMDGDINRRAPPKQFYNSFNRNTRRPISWKSIRIKGY